MTTGIGTYYSYDSTVPNARKICAGDLAVIRDRAHLLGVGVISGIRNWAGTKKRLRCPECRTTDFKERFTVLPRYRCGRRHVFDAPAEETIPVEHFRASYPNTWTSLAKRISVVALEDLMVSRAQQHAIRELHREPLRRMLAGLVPEQIWEESLCHKGDSS